MPNLKIICNLDCNLYIDGDLVQEMKADVITKVPLEVGEYYVDVVPLFNKEVSLRRFVYLEFDKILKMDLLFVLKYDLELRSKLDLVPQSNDSGLFGYNIKDTDINIIPYQFDEAETILEDYAIVKKGKYGVINRKNEIILDFVYDSIRMEQKKNDPNKIIGFVVSKKWMYGYVNKEGKQVVPCQWEACLLSDSFIYCHGDSAKGDCLFSYDGTPVLTAKKITPLFSFASFPYLILTENGEGVFDNNLKELVPAKFFSYRKYDSESENDPLWGIIVRGDPYREYDFREYYDSSGFSWVLPCYDRDASDAIRERVYSVKVYNYYDYDYCEDLPVVVLESTLNQFTPNLEAYHDMLHKSLDDEDINDAQKETIESRFELITRKGDRISLWPSEMVCQFHEKKAGVCQKGKWSFIDINGKYLCGFKYDEVWNYFGGTAVVHNENGYGVIDKDGNEIIPCQYDFIYDGSGDGSIAIAYESMKYITVLDANQDEGVYDRKGNMIAPIKKGQRVSFDEKGDVITSIKEE